MRKKLRAKQLVYAFESVVRVPRLTGDSIAVGNVLTGGPESDGNIRLSEFFSGSKSVSLEIGMGKGQFLTELAKRRPDEYFLGLEVKEERVLSAARKIDRLGLKNIKLILVDARRLDDLGFDGDIDTIYLNFSDPWPKKRHYKRRFTSPRYLEIYRKVLNDGGRLILKTDNRGLFNYSVDILRHEGWTLEIVDEDYHSPAGLVTEFEQKFLNRGLKIYYLEARYEV